LTVSVSVFPIYDLVRRVAGADADVALLVPPGRSEHGAEAPTGAREAVAGARVAVMVGLGLEPWMEPMLKEAAPRARLLKVGDRVPTLVLRPDGTAAPGDEDQGAPDPHVWLDPGRARLIVRAVAEELGKADTAHAIDYRKRATALDASLAALDTELETRTKALAIRGFVSHHGAFQYLADRYKLEVLAVLTPSPGAPPSAAHLERVRGVLSAKRVPALFREPQLDPSPVKLLADEAKLPLGILDPVGGSPETDTYEKLLRFDVAQLEAHLK
jgi:ABC-type Zn uptake system ZnuABC Zn-binding protein ZnuA